MIILLPYRRWRVASNLALRASDGEGTLVKPRHTFCELCGRYAANVIILLPYRRWRLASNLAPGPATARVPWQSAGGHSLVPNVHLQAGLLPNQVARCLMGQAIYQTV